MATKSSSSSLTVVLVLLILITFPFWIGVFGFAVGTVGGILGGVFGAVFGALGGVLGALMGLITWPFKMIFGHGHWFPHFNGYTVAVIVIIALLIARKKSKTT
jgi:hypothetical protein